MATIGTFKKTGSNEFTGEIVTLSVQAKNVRIVPDQRATGENAPSHRVLVGRAEIGAAWSKRSNEGRDYLGLKLDDARAARRLASRTHSGRRHRQWKACRPRHQSGRHAGHAHPEERCWRQSQP